MKKLLTYTLLVALTVQSFYRGIMAMDYQLHLPAYLAKCINKDRPQLHCNGQCALMKKIREKERNETKKNLLIYEYSSLYFHQASHDFSWLPKVADPTEMHATSVIQRYHFHFFQSIFRPPIFNSPLSLA